MLQSAFDQQVVVDRHLRRDQRVRETMEHYQLAAMRREWLQVRVESVQKAFLAINLGLIVVEVEVSVVPVVPEYPVIRAGEQGDIGREERRQAFKRRQIERVPALRPTHHTGKDQMSGARIARTVVN